MVMALTIEPQRHFKVAERGAPGAHTQAGGLGGGGFPPHPILTPEEHKPPSGFESSPKAFRVAAVYTAVKGNMVPVAEI